MKIERGMVHDWAKAATGMSSGGGGGGDAQLLG